MEMIWHSNRDARGIAGHAEKPDRKWLPAEFVRIIIALSQCFSTTGDYFEGD